MDADVPIPTPYHVGNLPVAFEVNFEMGWQHHIGWHQYARAERGNIPNAACHRAASILEIDKDALVADPLS